MRLQAQFVKTYTGKENEKKERTTMFLYYLTGTPEAKASYKAIKEKEGFYQEDEKGNPLWHTSRTVGKIGFIVITDDNKIVIDNDNIRIMNNQLEQMPDGILKTAMAQEIAKSIMANMIVPMPTVQAPAPTVESAPEVKQPDLSAE